MSCAKPFHNNRTGKLSPTPMLDPDTCMPAGTEIKPSVFSPVGRVKKRRFSWSDFSFVFVRFQGFGVSGSTAEENNCKANICLVGLFLFFTVQYITGL